MQFQPPFDFDSRHDVLEQCPLCEDRVLRSKMAKHVRRKHNKSLSDVLERRACREESSCEKRTAPHHASVAETSPEVPKPDPTRRQPGVSASLLNQKGQRGDHSITSKGHRPGNKRDLVSCEICGEKVRADRLDRHKKQTHRTLLPKEPLKRLGKIDDANSGSDDTVLCRLCGSRIPEGKLKEHIRAFHGYEPVPKAPSIETQPKNKRRFRIRARILQGGLPGLGKKR